MCESNGFLLIVIYCHADVAVRFIPISFSLDMFCIVPFDICFGVQAEPGVEALVHFKLCICHHSGLTASCPQTAVLNPHKLPNVIKLVRHGVGKKH